MQRNIVRFSGVLALGTALTLSMAACGGKSSSGGGGASGPVKIGFMGALTGDNAQLGINIRNGAKLAVDQYNATNPKIKVVFTEYDTQGDPAVAPSQAQKAISDKVVGIVGPAFSGESQAVDPILDQAQIPNISPSATNAALGEKGFKYWHRVVSNDDVQGAVDAQFIAKTLGAKNVFVVDDNQQYGLGIADTVASQLQSMGVKVQRDKIDPKASDYSSTVNKVRAAKPDALFYGGYYAEGGKLLKQLRDGGVTARFVSDDGANDPGLIKTAGAQEAEGALMSCACQSVASSNNPKVKKFIDDYKKAYGIQQGTYSAEGYDAATALLNAIKAGNTTGPKINDYLKTEDFQGVSKPIKFQPNGEIATSSIYMFEVKNGQITFLGDATKVKPQ